MRILGNKPTRKTISRAPTEVEMRKALGKLSAGMEMLDFRPDDDDPTVVLASCLDELIAARRMLAQMAPTMKLWVDEMTSRGL